MNNDLKLQSLTELVERFLPLQQWGFKQSALFIGNDKPYVLSPSGKMGLPIAIYDSDCCRVKFLFDEEDRSFQLSIYYGRLHVPNDKWLMKWNGEDCYCWHDIYKALKFLDGNTPREAIEKSHIRPEGLKEFKYVRGQDIDNQPEWDARIHAEFWNYYGDRLFEIFDLRRPKLWERYAQFIYEYYSLSSERYLEDMGPSKDKIC